MSDKFWTCDYCKRGLRADEIHDIDRQAHKVRCNRCWERQIWPYDEPIMDVLNLDTWTEDPPVEHHRDRADVAADHIDGPEANEEC